MNYDPKELVDDYLAHHGIQGQKWGVRHGPPYPLDREVSSRVKRGEDATRVGKEYSSKDFKYHSMAMQEFRQEMKNTFLVNIPFLGPAYWLYSNIRYGINSTDKKDYTQTEGQLEKLSQLKKKESPTSSDEDVKVVNPRIGQQKGTVNNCTNCTMAMEMRSRGYDVRARKRANGRFNGEWKDYFTNVPKTWMTLRITDFRKPKQEATHLYQELCKHLESEGKGARGHLSINWINGGAHSIFWKVEDGGVKFYDGQTGRSGHQIDNYFSLAGSVQYLRLDDKKVKPKITDAVISRGYKGDKNDS